MVIDQHILSVDTKVKELKEWCAKLGLATSGSKMKILNRLKAYKANEERKIALELAKKLYAEDERRPAAISVPKLPTRAEQDLVDQSSPSTMATLSLKGKMKSDSSAPGYVWWSQRPRLCFVCLWLERAACR